MAKCRYKGAGCGVPLDEPGQHGVLAPEAALRRNPSFAAIFHRAMFFRRCPGKRPGTGSEHFNNTFVFAL